MPRVKPHHHPCQDCGTKTECPGTWEENYDGFPAVVCDEVDRRGHEPLCEDCYEKREADAKREAQAVS